jgi:endonuclease/exonuclease/phosphatase family metal-dependent hydrolase
MKVASWNVLCSQYSWITTFPNCTKRELSWEARWPQLQRIITSLQADVITLQEVDHVEEYERLLHTMGYEVAYQQRPGGKVDGCLTAWRRGLFSLLAQKSISYDDLAIMATSEMLIPHAKICKHNVALLVKLKRISDGIEIVVANTHLHFDPAAEDVKMLQNLNFFKVVDQFNFAPHSPTGHMPTIACGDFNSMPSSDIYRLIVEGRTPPQKLVQPFQRFLFDDSLARVARWLRLLGFDAEIFAISKDRAEADLMFQACKMQHRLLVTASRFLAARSECTVTRKALRMTRAIINPTNLCPTCFCAPQEIVHRAFSPSRKGRKGQLAPVWWARRMRWSGYFKR